MSKHTVEIKAYVTSKGGVVVLNGPFPMKEAERVRALCDAAPDMLEALEMAIAHELHGDGRCGCCWTDKAHDAIDKARREA